MIVMYHKIDTFSPTMWWVNVDKFYEQMCQLSRYDVVYLDDYDPGNRRHAVITFDGVYQNVLAYAAPILKKFGYPFELFISSDLIGRSNDFDLVEPSAPFASKQELAELVRLGGRLQWHTRSHPLMNYPVSESNRTTVDFELSIPDDVKELDPIGFKWFAYPYGEFSDDVYNVVKGKFSGAVSCDQGNDEDTYCLNRITMTNSSLRDDRSVCIIVVSHNYGEFLSEAIESVLTQTYSPDQILIMDDASTDGTHDIGERYASLYPDKITYIRNEENLGIVDTFNKAVSMSTSDYICFLGADNRLPANYVEQCIRTLLAGDASIAYTDFRLFGPNARDEYFKHPADRRGRVIESVYYEVVFPEFSGTRRLEGNFIHGSAMYARKAFNAAGGYLPRNPGRPEDANIFKRMLNAGFTAMKAGNTWLEYRQHSDQQANIVSRTQGELEFYRAYSRRLELKVKTLEISFGLLSPAIKLLSFLEKALFETLVKAARIWRRIF